MREKTSELLMLFFFFVLPLVRACHGCDIEEQGMCRQKNEKEKKNSSDKRRKTVGRKQGKKT